MPRSNPKQPIDPKMGARNSGKKGSPSNEDQDLKKLRNRLSQRAFRRRQAAYIKELKERVDSGEKPQSEIIAALQEENSRLRKQLIEVQSKISRMIVTMQVLSGSVTTELRDAEASRPDDNDPPTAEDTATDDEYSKPESTSTNDIPGTSSFPMNRNPQRVHDMMETPECFPGFEKWFAQPSENNTAIEANFAEFTSMTQQIPNIWSFGYQMGPEAYSNASARIQSSSFTVGKSWAESNSPFSDHINVLQQLLRDKAEQKQPTHTPRFLYHQVLMALSLFNSITRPDAMAWYSRTRIYQIVHLMTWQLYPCIETFCKIHPSYRPTTTQLQHEYPSMIDWIPFPSIRDRLIKSHAANPDIDQIFCDAVSSYVVEAAMSDLIRGAPSMKAYVRVTDLLANMDSAVECSEIDISNAIPAPDTSTLFSSPECSHAAFKLLKMDRGASYYRIDPAFFGKYPELYDADAKITAEGIPLRPDFQIRLTAPKLLDVPMFQTYRSFIDYSMEAPFLCATLA